MDAVNVYGCLEFGVPHPCGRHRLTETNGIWEVLLAPSTRLRLILIGVEIPD